MFILSFIRYYVARSFFFFSEEFQIFLKKKKSLVTSLTAKYFQSDLLAIAQLPKCRHLAWMQHYQIVQLALLPCIPCM